MAICRVQRQEGHARWGDLLKCAHSRVSSEAASKAAGAEEQGALALCNGLKQAGPPEQHLLCLSELCGLSLGHVNQTHLQEMPHHEEITSVSSECHSEMQSHKVQLLSPKKGLLTMGEMLLS